MAPHSSTLAWKIPWAGEPGGLQSMGLRRVGHDWATSLSLFTFMHWRRKRQRTPVFLPGESQGWGGPGGLPSMGSHGVGHDWSDLAAAAAMWFSLHVSLLVFAVLLKSVNLCLQPHFRQNIAFILKYFLYPLYLLFWNPSTFMLDHFILSHSFLGLCLLFSALCPCSFLVIKCSLYMFIFKGTYSYFSPICYLT